jgi:(4-(4-[2-(gamma-L-glutamylamino)ethyl]phenoxymethyl)furan-2-yl)methanamine synthase
LNGKLAWQLAPQMPMQVVGFDIGGANLKAADADGRAVTRPFAVWKAPEKLAAEVERLLMSFARPDAIALTMTAELADCFRTKRDGVDAVLAAVELAAGETPVFVWQTSGCFVVPHAARATPLLTAAANWHALATYIGRFVPEGPSLLIDIGTTTADLIPLNQGTPVSIGRTDPERLQSGELVYSGVKRTPICALVSEVPFRRKLSPVAAELFATTLDVYLALGRIPEDPLNTETANGRPATVAMARDRLARSLCCDATEFSDDDMAEMARSIAQAQRRQIARGIELVLAAQHFVPRQVVISGAGSFLAEETVAEMSGLAGAERIRLSDRLGPAVAEAACAFALARLALEAGLPA